MKHGAASCKVEALPIELLHDRHDPFFDELVLLKLNIMQDPLDLYVALLQGIALFFDCFKVFFQLVEGVDERFTVIDRHFMLFHESLVLLVEDVVVHLQVGKLTEALSEASLKMRKVPLRHGSGLRDIGFLGLGARIRQVVINKSFIVIDVRVIFFIQQFSPGDRCP